MPIGLALIVVASAGFGQSDAYLKFEVASIKPAVPTVSLGQYGAIPNGFVATNTPIRPCIAFAYDSRVEMVEGPEWMNPSSRFDITAKAADHVSIDQVRVMMRRLLEDRFHLSVHWETRQKTLNTLSVSKDGPRNLEWSTSEYRQTIIPGPIKADMTQHFEFRNATMSGLAIALSRLGNTPEPVVDSTGIDRKFNAVLVVPVKEPEMTPEDYQFSLLFPAVEKQLGIKVKTGKVPAKVLVVDHIDKMPTEN